MADEATEAKNTDRELWRERPEDYYAPSIFVTEGGGIGINVDGHVIVKPVRDWHRLAMQEWKYDKERRTLVQRGDADGTT